MIGAAATPVLNMLIYTDYLRPIVSIVFWYLSFPLAGRTFLHNALAPPQSERPCHILISGKNRKGQFSHLLESPVLGVEGIVMKSLPLAIRALHHANILSTAGAVVTAVSCTDRATHTSVHFLTDQHTHAQHANPTHPMKPMMFGSTMDAIRATMPTIANTPAKIVSRTLPANPMTFMKVFDTILSILLLLLLGVIDNVACFCDFLASKGFDIRYLVCYLTIALRSPSDAL